MYKNVENCHSHGNTSETLFKTLSLSEYLKMISEREIRQEYVVT